MISLISNASMNSPWVINEIDLANKTQTPLIPIMLEKLDVELEFKIYNVRFINKHHITYKNDFEDLSNKIISSLKELGQEKRYKRLFDYREIVMEILSQYDYNDTLDAFSYFLEFLQDLHIVIAAGAELYPTNRISKFIGIGTCRTIPEALMCALQDNASMISHNFENGKKKSSEHNWWWEERLKPSKFLAEVLTTIVEKWQPFVEETKKMMVKNNKAKQNI